MNPDTKLFACRWSLPREKFREYGAVMLPCACRVDEGLLLRAVRMGANKVVLLCCKREGCRYRGANENVKTKTASAVKLLKRLGMEQVSIVELELGPFEPASATEILEKVERTLGFGPRVAATG